ncbi:hypothetical protein AAFF_G00411590 [Aldrovandia affinis]|uniref:Vacuolar protein 8 n=1 Tax=Aldrovandia affinis TaxID=143900 RepID=A0AAD7WJP8_9TELE|nr:hypothetical protein AAFF_G00411590 [Aldrovandia affinis]
MPPCFRVCLLRLGTLTSRLYRKRRQDMGTGLCDRCAQLVEDFVTYVQRVSSNLVEKIKECVKAIAHCCCLRKKTTAPRTFVQPLVQEHERRAARELLQHLDAGGESGLLGRQCLNSLNTLAESENHELQQSASVYLLHLSQQLAIPLPSAFLDPYPALLRSSDLEVQRTASLSLVNLLVEHNVNKELVVEMGMLEPILDMLESGDPTLQCNSCACVAMLANSATNREAITSADGVLRILVLAKSYDPRVQKNAVGALLNLTRSERILGALCSEGALPVLALLLQSADSEVQYYSCCALRNVAAVLEYHPRMLGIGDRFLLKSLLSLLSSPVEKNSCQACLCLRNLAVNVRTQEELMALDCVSPLTSLLRSPALGKSESAITLLSALSQHPPNRDKLVEEGLIRAVGELLLLHGSSTTVLSHGAMTIANLSDTATGQQAVMDSDCVPKLLEALATDSITEEAQLCVASCLHHLTSLESLRPHIAEKMTADHVYHLASFATQAENPELSFHVTLIIGELEMNGGCFAAAVSGSAVQQQLHGSREQTECTSELLTMVQPLSLSPEMTPSTRAQTDPSSEGPDPVPFF